MMSLSDQQLKSLSALWAGLPDHIRLQLLAAAGEKGRLAETLIILEQSRSSDPLPSGLRHPVFQNLADVTGLNTDPPTHSRFTDEILSSFAAETDLKALVSPSNSSDPDAIQAWRSKAAELVAGLTAKTEKDKALRLRLVDTAGTDFPSLIEDVACLLTHDQKLTEALMPFDEIIGDFTPELVSTARDAYEDICNDVPEAGLWFLKILTARLSKTAQIFRVVEKIGRRSDDALVSKTDLADVGDLVLANADFYAGQFDRAPSTIAEADAAGYALEEFAKISVGMTREFGIRKDGRWGKKLFATRAKASNALDQFFKQFEKDFARALPQVAKGHRGLAKAGSMPSEDRIQKTEAELRFLALATEWASQAAVGSAQKHAADHVRQEMDDSARAFLEILRAAEGEGAENASDALALIVRYMHAFMDDQNADLIQRRSVAVQANAA